MLLEWATDRFGEPLAEQQERLQQLVASQSADDVKRALRLAKSWDEFLAL